MTDNTVSWREQCLRDAIALSRGNVLTGGGPFGAVIARTDTGEVVAATGNRVTADNDPTAHAEVCAIRTACASLGTFTLVGYSLFSSCEPCPMCLGAVYWARLDAVYFAATRHDAAETGFDDAFLYTELVRPVGERTIPTVFVAELQSAATETFQHWLSAQTRVAY